MEEFSIINERIKGSIHAFLEDTSNSPINEFDLKFFKSICADCARRDCTIQHTLLNANMISSCKYFTRTAATSDIKAVGGTIFYIDDKADGEYQFFDADGNLIENVQVGDRPYYYRVLEKGAKDKYYVYHDEMHMAKRWTYLKDESFVYDAINLPGKGIGKGKINTEIMMARDNGAYVTLNSGGCPTIWYQLQRARDAKVSGCDDWFIPSKKEIEELRLAIKSGSITGGEIAGASYEESIFSKSGGYYLWSSSGYSSQYAWLWYCPNQSWYASYKAYRYSVFFVRAF